MIDPTRGVDVGARREIKADLVRSGGQGPGDPARLDRRRGTGDACDRVIVMRHGRRVGELSGSDLTERNLMRMAADG